MAKRSKNLSLDPEAVERAERYSELHGTNVSQLVNDLLGSLPLPDDTEGLTPTVRRLLGIGKATSDPIGDYRMFLQRKHL